MTYKFGNQPRSHFHILGTNWFLCDFNRLQSLLDCSIINSWGCLLQRFCVVEYSCLASARVQWAVINITGMGIYRPLLQQSAIAHCRSTCAAWTTICQYSSQHSFPPRGTPSSDWIHVTLCFFKSCPSNIAQFIAQRS